MEFKDFPADIKTFTDNSGDGMFEAIISTNALDRDGESIAPGAFDPLPSEIPVYHQHDWREAALPVGKARPFYDVAGLKATGSFAPTARGQEIRSLVTGGFVTGLSVGFANAKRSKIDGLQTVTKGDLFEVSFTAVPCNPSARVLTAKSGARNSAADLELLQTAHDAISNLGAGCDTGKAWTDEEADLYLEAIDISIRTLCKTFGVDLEDEYPELREAIRATTGLDPLPELLKLKGR